MALKDQKSPLHDQTATREQHGAQAPRCHLMGSDDPSIDFAHRVIRWAVKFLAWLMVLVIFWGILDVLYVFYTRLSQPPFFLLNINDILATFGAFMAVLIAIEIFINIVMYLESDVIHVRLVLDTAVMAAARKVIVLDFNKLDGLEVAALGIVLLSLGVCYYLVVKHRLPGGDRFSIPLVSDRQEEKKT